MTKIFNRVLRDRNGATAIEYGLIAALVALAIVAGLGTLGTNLNTQFSNIAAQVQTNNAAAN